MSFLFEDGKEKSKIVVCINKQIDSINLPPLVSVEIFFVSDNDNQQEDFIFFTFSVPLLFDILGEMGTNNLSHICHWE